MITKMKTSSEKPKEKVRWKIKVTKFDLVKLFILYIALSPICAMGLYNHLLFFPFKDAYDLSAVFEKIESMTDSKKIDVTIASGKNEKLSGWYFKKAGAKKYSSSVTGTEVLSPTEYF